MKFAAKTEAEVSNLLFAGVYDAEIGTAEDSVSSTGNEMIVLDITVFGGNENKKFIKDYLVEAMAFKLRHAAEACGLLSKYEAGNLMADDFIGKSCKVKVAVEDKDPNYAPKNVIKDYVVIKGAEQPQKSVDEVLNDRVPF